MAQKLETALHKLLDKHSVKDITDTMNSIVAYRADVAAWNDMSDDDKTQWFYDQCAKYGFSTKQSHNRIIVNELCDRSKAYMTVFMTREHDSWHLEIGGAYIGNNNGGIWHTHNGLKGKEQQIAEMVNLHIQGQ